MRIVFMGTPEFAVPSLDILVKNGFDVVGVITAPDRVGGRGNKLIESDVKKYALANGLRILQPEKLKNPDFLKALADLKPDLQVVVAFRMLPEVVWAAPPLGTINLHGSLLPRYRGAAPINWAVINGEKETGVTTFFLKHEIDTGDVLMRTSLPIEEKDTAGTIHDKMMLVGAETLLASVRKIEQGNYQPLPQSDVEATHAPKIFHETCALNFNQPVEKVYDFIRGLSPYPAAWTTLKGEELKVYESEKELVAHQEEVGSFHSDNKKYLKVACTNGFIHFTNVKLQGKKQMNIKDFLNGNKI